MIDEMTKDKLKSMRMFGMIKALQEQGDDFRELSFEERLGLLVDREYTERENTKLANRLRTAKLRQNGCIENVQCSSARGLDKQQLLSFTDARWIKEHRNILITGATGTGKSYIACALSHRACVMGFKAMYHSAARLFEELQISKGDGTHLRLMRRIAKADVLIIDDFGLFPLDQEQRRELYEIMEDRYALRSTIITSQLPVDQWHNIMGNKTVADAILDRVVHNATRLELKGKTRR